MTPPLVLFVCTGNICRSPMAAALFRARVEHFGHNLQVESAGTWGVDGHPASLLAQKVMAQRGLNLDGHLARTVTRELLADADVIIVMTRSHRDALAAEFPETQPKMHLMSNMVGLEFDIADPYGEPLEVYELCAADLEQLIERGYPRVLQWLYPALQALPDP